MELNNILIYNRVLGTRVKLIFFLSFVPFFNSCINNSQTNSQKTRTTATENKKVINIKFRTVSDVVHYTRSITWINRNNTSTSLGLYFNLSSSDTLDMSYSNECWFRFPYKIKNDKVVVYWDTNIDTKYNFNVVRTARQLDKKLIGKPFMVLKLVNDTTLKATYPNENIKKALNESDKDRVLFPNIFICYINELLL